MISETCFTAMRDEQIRRSLLKAASFIDLVQLGIIVIIPHLRYPKIS
jgi:hypothetical protein